MDTTTHPDSLWPTRVGGKLQQQGEGGAGAKGSELRAIRMVLSEHQCLLLAMRPLLAGSPLDFIISKAFPLSSTRSARTTAPVLQLRDEDSTARKGSCVTCTHGNGEQGLWHAETYRDKGAEATFLEGHP
jgi:hypothetical protein